MEVQFVAPFRSKKVTDWNTDDVTDWIDSIQINAAPKYQSGIAKHKTLFKQAAVANQLNGKLLLTYRTGQKLYKHWKQYGLSEAFCNKVVEQLKNILNAEAAFGFGTFMQPQQFSNKKRLKISKAPSYRQVQQSYELQNEVKFEIGQRFEAKDARTWLYAIAKEVIPGTAVKIGWLCDKWAHETYDIWIYKSEWDTRIRDPTTKRPYSSRISKKRTESKTNEHKLLQQQFNDVLQQYSVLKNENANKEKQNLKLTQTKDDLTAVNASLKQQTVAQERKYDLLLEKHNKATREISFLKQSIEQKERDYNDVKTVNATVMETNNDLNEECKELKMELKDIKDKYNKFVRQNSDYTTWDYDTITDWIIGLNKEFIRYENELRKMLKEEEISGADLIDLDKNDLSRFGIKVFKHKKIIIQEIQNLVMQKQNNNVQNENIVAYNEGKKDTVYIEQ